MYCCQTPSTHTTTSHIINIGHVLFISNYPASKLERATDVSFRILSAFSALAIPQTIRQMIGDRAFAAAAAPRVWNELPSSSVNVSSFRVQNV